MNNNSCVVLISYNPDINILTNVNALLEQVGEVIIVDNGSGEKSLAILESLPKSKKIVILHNPTNLGIATALNQGVRYAIAQGYEWIATFDQDSLAPENFIQTMLNDYESYDDHEIVAVVCPKYQINNDTISFSQAKETGKISAVKTTMTSGNLIKTSTFEKVGFFNDSFFIDYVDHEFCLRVRSNKLQIVESQNSILKHSLGESNTYQFMKIKIVTTDHSPIRRYYKYRNMVKTFKMYYWFEPFMLITQFKSLLIEPIKILCLEKNKIEKISSIYKGVFDGVF
jgi:rhamnosyltransferase